VAITTLDGYIASAKQRVTWMKTASRTTIATFPFSLFELAGQPGAGTLAIGNTANGVVPTDATNGYPLINAFGGSNTGYLSKAEFASTVAGWIDVYDRVFAAGAYAFNANTTLASQPSYSGRVPGGTDFNGLQIWIEQVTAGTLVQNVAVTYTNQAGTTGRATGATAVPGGAAATVGRCWQLPLAAGDSGVQKIETVVGSVASAGTFNVMVLRPIWSGRVQIANGGDVHELLRTGMPQLFDTSALYALIAPDSTSTGVPELMLEVANG
jgi:hypothetical protein